MTFAQDFSTVARLVSAAQGVQPELFTSAKKGSPEVVSCRQLMIYLLHTEGGYQQKQIAQAMHRHHSTVKHALDVVEDRRECPTFDGALERLARTYRDLIVSPQASAKPTSTRLSDPLTTLITNRLILADLWRSDSSIQTTRDPSRIGLSVFLPELTQGDRQHDHERAQAIRRVLTESLMEAHFRSVFTDALWCGSGKRGWRVVARAQSARVQQPA